MAFLYLGDTRKILVLLLSGSDYIVRVDQVTG